MKRAVGQMGPTTIQYKYKNNAMQIQMTLYILRLSETHTLKLYALPFLATPPHPPYTLTLQAPPKPALTECGTFTQY